MMAHFKFLQMTKRKQNVMNETRCEEWGEDFSVDIFVQIWGYLSKLHSGKKGLHFLGFSKMKKSLYSLLQKSSV